MNLDPGNNLFTKSLSNQEMNNSELINAIAKLAGEYGTTTTLGQVLEELLAQEKSSKTEAERIQQQWANSLKKAQSFGDSITLLQSG